MIFINGLSFSALLLAAAASSATAFVPSSCPSRSHHHHAASSTRVPNASFSLASTTRSNDNDNSETSSNIVSNSNSNNNKVPTKVPTAATVASTTAAVWLALIQSSAAAGPDWGIFEGRSLSLLHPVMMGSLLLYGIYTAFLGFQWRRQRTMGDEINDLKKSLPNLDGASSVAEALQAAKSAETVDNARVSALQAAVSTEQQITDLKTERKELAEAGPRDKHWSQGALLAFLGTAFAIEGPLNTYARAGKLFPGPHLYAGAGLVVLWALAASCVPAMQKGNDTARAVHIGANVGGLGLFAWQVVSGIPILLKVIEKTSWP